MTICKTDTRAALAQALEALRHHRDQTRPIDRTEAAITAAEAALAPPQGEPVAWMYEHFDRELTPLVRSTRWIAAGGEWIESPLYAAPAAPARAAPQEPVAECADNDSPWLVCKPCAAAGRCAKEAAPAQAAPQKPVVPAGWVLVPVEATPEMIAALLGRTRFDNSWLPAYRDMLAAAPAAPVRQPLTDTAINAVFEAIPMEKYDGVLSIARAIEHAHGITGDTK